MTRIVSIKTFLFLLLFLFNTQVHAQKHTLSDSLSISFNKLWNANDIEGMYTMLQPDAFFKSPFQLRYGRDTMKATVLKRNPLSFKNIRSTELYSHLETNMCYSLGTMTFGVYDTNGKYTGKDETAEYIYIFTRNKKKEWKLQSIIYHEEKKAK